MAWLDLGTFPFPSSYAPFLPPPPPCGDLEMPLGDLGWNGEDVTVHTVTLRQKLALAVGLPGRNVHQVLMGAFQTF